MLYLRVATPTGSGLRRPVGGALDGQSSRSHLLDIPHSCTLPARTPGSALGGRFSSIVRNRAQIERRVGMTVIRVVSLALTLFVAGHLLCCGASEDSYAKEDRSTWGSFSTWCTASKFEPAYNEMRTFANDAATLGHLEDSLTSARRSNDAAVVRPVDIPEPVFPESTGSFEFVQILSQYDGTSVFRASDGLFVLQLSPGDSFSAYPGQNVFLTMHDRGETMSLTVGQAAVFRSGPSPTVTQHHAGFEPDRTREYELRERVETMEESILGRLDETRTRLRGPFYARIDVRLDGLRPTRFLVLDARGPVFCITDADPHEDCPEGSVEHVALTDLMHGSAHSTRISQSAPAKSGETDQLVQDVQSAVPAGGSTDSSRKSDAEAGLSRGDAVVHSGKTGSSGEMTAPAGPREPPSGAGVSNPGLLPAETSCGMEGKTGCTQSSMKNDDTHPSTPTSRIAAKDSASATDSADERLQFEHLLDATEVPEVGNREKSKRLNQSGYVARTRRSDNRSAMRLYRAAIRADPSYEWPHYNLACELSLVGKTDAAIAELLVLRRLGTPVAQDALRAALSDPDLSTIRSSRLFQLIVAP